MISLIVKFKELASEPAESPTSLPFSFVKHESLHHSQLCPPVNTGVWFMELKVNVESLQLSVCCREMSTPSHLEGPQVP